MKVKPVSEAVGWNTWDFRSYNTVTCLEKGCFTFKLFISVYDPNGDVHYTRFRWPDMPVRGPHAPDGSYWGYIFTTPAGEYQVQAAGGKQTLDLVVRPLTSNDKCRVIISFLPAGEERMQRTKHGFKTGQWNIQYPGFYHPDDRLFFIPNEYPYVFNEPGQSAGLHIEPQLSSHTLNTIEKKIARAERAYRTIELAGEGGMADTLMAVPRSVTWNTIYDSRWTGVSTQISRDWGADWCGSYNFPWDQFFMGYLANTVGSEISLANFKAILASATPEGFLPNYYASFGIKSFDRSQPPVGSYLVWKTWCLKRDKKLLSETYAGLKRWHDWWFTARDSHKTGLLSWGSNKKPVYDFPHLKKYNPSQQNEHICALYEAGMDNFPVMNKLKFDKKGQTLAGSCVALNSLYTMDCEALAAIAAELGHAEDARRYADEADRMKSTMREKLYDKKSGMYCLRAWNGTWIRELSVINFYPMAAGVATPEQARFMVEEIMLDPEKFWGEYVISVTAMDYPASSNNDYWAGRIWPPTNFIVYEGLKRYGYDAVAAEFALKCLRMFETGWMKANMFCENYNMITGLGDDVWNSNTGYGWGALLANFALQELIDVEGWQRVLRIGTRSQQKWGVKAYVVGTDTYRISSAYDGLRVSRNGKTWLKTSSPAVLRFAGLGEKPYRISINADRPGRLTIMGLKPGESVQVCQGCKPVLIKAGKNGSAVFTYDCVKPCPECLRKDD